jgi:Transglutaminase-like superfamily
MKKHLIIIFIFFSISVFSQSNNIREIAKEISNKSFRMSELLSFTNEKFTDSIDKAKFLYYWIGLNINYDYELWEKKSSSIDFRKEYSYNYYPEQIFAKKVAVCLGYSKLYEWFMNELGIESTIVTGFIRDQRNHYIELESDSDFSHAWNAIKLNDQWMLVDTTWGTSLNEEVSDFYFDMPPERAIITHFPEKNIWQLLEKPLSLEEFNKSKFINPIWFKVGFSDIPKVKMDSQYYYFVFRSNPNKEWMVNLLYSVDNKEFHKLRELNKIVQEDYTILRFYKSIIPKKTYFKVNLYKLIGEVDYSLWYSDVINFKI